MPTVQQMRPWRTRPTTRRTSKADYVDVVGGEHDQYIVARYIHPDDARLMVASPSMVDALETARIALTHPEAESYRREALAEVLAALALATGQDQ